MKILKLVVALLGLLTATVSKAQSFTVTSPANGAVYQEYDIIRITFNVSADINYIGVTGYYQNSNSPFWAGILFEPQAGYNYIDYFIHPDSIDLAPRQLDFNIQATSSTGASFDADVTCIVNPSLPTTILVSANDTTVCKQTPVDFSPIITGGTAPYNLSIIDLGAYVSQVACNPCTVFPGTNRIEEDYTGTTLGLRVEDANGNFGFTTLQVAYHPVPKFLNTTDTLGYNWHTINYGNSWPCGAVANPELQPNTATQPQLVSTQWINDLTGQLFSNALNPDFVFAPGYNQYTLKTTDTYGCTINRFVLDAFTHCDNLPVVANTDCFNLSAPDSVIAGNAYFTLNLMGNDVCDTSAVESPYLILRAITQPTIGNLTYAAWNNYWTYYDATAHPWGSFHLVVPVANLQMVDSFKYVLTSTTSPNIHDTTWVYINAPCPPPSGLVWPGDADNNGFVDNADLLPIGVGYNTTGPQRSGATNNWVGQTCTDWNDTLADGTNYKFADCNGSGTIDADDTLAIQQNFYFAHPRSGNEWRANAPVLGIQLLQDTLGNTDTLRAQITLGDINMPASNVYGVAFDINFDVNVADTSHMNITYVNSWLGNTNDLLTLTRTFKSQGLIKTAVTRYDHITRSGHGVIALADFLITTSNINGKDLSYYQSLFSISNITMIDADANYLEVNPGSDTVTVGFEPTGITDLQLSRSISMFPNPAKNTLTVFSNAAAITGVKIVNLLGEEVIAQPVTNTNRQVLNVAGLSAGLYIVQINTSAGVVIRKVTVER